MTVLDCYYFGNGCSYRDTPDENIKCPIHKMQNQSVTPFMFCTNALFHWRSLNGRHWRARSTVMRSESSQRFSDRVSATFSWSHFRGISVLFMCWKSRDLGKGVRDVLGYRSWRFWKPVPVFILVVSCTFLCIFNETRVIHVLCYAGYSHLE